jgi:hypothetical protein
MHIPYNFKFPDRKTALRYLKHQKSLKTMKKKSIVQRFVVALNPDSEIKILHLNLRKKWFDMVFEGIKTDEYRGLTSYWTRRLFDLDGKPKKFDFVCFRNGYSPFADEMIFEFNGIETGFPNPEWTDKPDECCFKIKLGDAVYTNVN